MRIRFTVHSDWAKNQEALANRLQAIISGHLHDPPVKLDNGTWMLEPGNNWWLEPIWNNEFELRYRYLKTPEQEAALKTVIEMLLE